MTLHRVIRTGFVVLGVTFMLSVPVGADLITYVGNGYEVSYDPSLVVFDPYNLPHWHWLPGADETGDAGNQDGYSDPLLLVAPRGQETGPNLPWHPTPSALGPGGAGSGPGGPTILDPFDPGGLPSGSTTPGAGGNNYPNGPWEIGDPDYENGTGPTYDPTYEMETQPVPEPSTLLLLTTGLALAGLRHRRRQR